jgi:hypothetical protein
MIVLDIRGTKRPKEIRGTMWSLGNLVDFLFLIHSTPSSAFSITHAHHHTGIHSSTRNIKQATSSIFFGLVANHKNSTDFAHSTSKAGGRGSFFKRTKTTREEEKRQHVLIASLLTRAKPSHFERIRTEGRPR